MARYGIKYEQDFDGRMIPTCYAASIESVMKDDDYQKALQYADAECKAYYERQAEYIERVRKEWVEKASKEKPYDIFICYKDSDIANGIERTQDSIAAQDLYIHLMNKGYRVFYSHESLRDKVGEKYEPYIFNALSTAKVMLVYGSKPEYITSTWLKNEWTRYEKRIQAGEKNPNSLLVACEGFSPGELPTALSSRQCFNAGEKSFYGDLDEAIEHIVHPKKEKEIYIPSSEKKKSKAPLWITLFLTLALAIGFITVQSLMNTGETVVTNTEYNATVSAEGGILPNNAEFRVEEVLRDQRLEAIVQTLPVAQDKYHFYDMELWHGGSVLNINGTVTVTLPLPEGISEEDAVVYHMSGKTPEKISSRTADGKIIFETTHFSVYMIAKSVCEHIPLIDPAVSPTCTEEGLTEGKHCALCDEILVPQTTVPPTHTRHKRYLHRTTDLHDLRKGFERRDRTQARCRSDLFRAPNLHGLSLDTQGKA